MPKHNLPRMDQICLPVTTATSSWRPYIPAIGILNAEIGEGNGLYMGATIHIETLSGEVIKYSIETLPRGRYEAFVEFDKYVSKGHWKKLYAPSVLFWWGHKYWGHLNLRFQAPYMGVFVDSSDEKALITAQELYDKMTFGSSK